MDLAVIGDGPARRRGDGLRLGRRRAVRAPRRGPGPTRAAAAAAANAVAHTLRRLLGEPAPDPAFEVDADLRPEGRQGALVRSLDAFREYYERWVSVWEAQALLRAAPVAGDADLGAGVRRADRPDPLPGGRASPPSRSPRSGGSRPGSSGERLPRGADPATHTKLGRGGLADVEWTVQLLQLEHAARAPGAAGARHRRPRWTALAEAALLTAEQAEALRGGVGAGQPGAQRGVPGPRPAQRPAAATRAGAGRRRPRLRLRRPTRTRASSSTTTAGPPGAPAASSTRSSTASRRRLTRRPAPAGRVQGPAARRRAGPAWIAARSVAVSGGGAGERVRSPGGPSRGT